MLVDSHCHLDFEEFDHDREAVIKAAHDVGVSNVLVPATEQLHWNRTVNTAKSFQLPFALGMHPMFISHHQPHHLLDLDKAIEQHRPLAVGEIGLDFFDKNLDREKQEAYFSKQLIIAKRHRLPVIIHCRKAHDTCIRYLEKHGVDGGIIHAFNGSIQQAGKYIDMGFKLGFGGMLTYARSSKLRKLAESLPIESLVLETDAPDMVVAAHRGQRNSPAYLPMVAQSLAELRGISVDEVATATTYNFASLFS